MRRLIAFLLKAHDAEIEQQTRAIVKEEIFKSLFIAQYFAGNPTPRYVTRSEWQQWTEANQKYANDGSVIIE